jgi:hypothetical protein
VLYGIEKMWPTGVARAMPANANKIPEETEEEIVAEETTEEVVAEHFNKTEGINGGPLVNGTSNDVDIVLAPEQGLAQATTEETELVPGTPLENEEPELEIVVEAEEEPEIEYGVA